MNKILILFSTLALITFSSSTWSKSSKTESLKAYGKIGVMGYAIEDDISLENLGSRIGLKAKKKVKELYLIVYARGEWSFNAIENSADLSIGSDNNIVSDSEAGDAFRRRLGFIGFKSPSFGDLRIGKQWSVYSDVSHFTDNFNIFGGAASGTYNLNTDGGQSGTGRVSKGITYRNSIFGFEYGLQTKLIQNKKLSIAGSETSLVAKDAYALSIKKKLGKYFQLGIAYNQIELDGDKGVVTGFSGGNSWSAVAGIKMTLKDFLLAVTLNQSKDHEMDDNKEIFNGEGLEVYSKYTYSEKISYYGGFNSLKPAESDYTNEYQVKDYIIGSQYALKNLKFVLEARITESINFDGKTNTNRYGIGTVFNF
jgi:predicted porin